MAAVKFYCVRSGETVEATSEPMIAAYFNSSDLNPNGIVQDYGWRLHPSMVKRIREVEDDDELVEKIAKDLEIPVENLATYHILMYLVQRDARAEAKQNKTEKNEFQAEYDRLLAEELAEGEDDATETTSTSTEASKPKTRAPRKRTASPAEIEAQKKKDDDILAKMIAEDDNKDS